VRRTRGIVRSGPDRGGLWALLEESPDVEAFGRGAAKLALSDVLDLTWITGAPLEMRAIQEMLERLVTSVLGAVRPRFEPHDEPRFRSALRLALGEIDRTAAHGGVLNPWPGGPKGADAAYVRIFLEPWASVSSGTVIAFSPLPEGRKALGEACPGV
jgi:hypothetical protein